MKIAVYGTLRAAYGNHRLIQGRSTFIGKGLTVDRHGLYASGIPFVVQNDNKSRIVVEVYEVPEKHMSSVDGLEGHPDWYQRRITPVELEDGEVVEAWLYFMDLTEEHKRRNTFIESGDYADYRKENSY